MTLVTADIDKHSDVDNADDCCAIFCGPFAIQLGRFVVFVRVYLIFMSD